MMRRTRAYRRYQRQKKLRKTIRWMRYWGWWFGDDEKAFQMQARIRAITPAICSCDTCGNPRYSPWYNEEEKLTIQERRHNEMVLAKEE